MPRRPKVESAAVADKPKVEETSKTETALRKKRSQRSFPASTFEEPLEFAAAVFRIGSGQPVKRLTQFDQLGKSPESGGSRQLIINSGKYAVLWRNGTKLCHRRLRYILTYLNRYAMVDGEWGGAGQSFALFWQNLGSARFNRRANKAAPN